MLDLSKVKIVKQGIFNYDNKTQYQIIIIEKNTKYGTGDYEDPPDIADDKECLCYYTWYSSPGNKQEFHTGTGPFPTITSAIKAAETDSCFLGWLD